MATDNQVQDKLRAKVMDLNVVELIAPAAQALAMMKQAEALESVAQAILYLAQVIATKDKP